MQDILPYPDFFKLPGIDAFMSSCKNFQELVGTNAPFRVDVDLKFKLLQRFAPKLWQLEK